MTSDTAATVRIALRQYRRYCLRHWLEAYKDEDAPAVLEFGRREDLETWANEIRMVNDAAKELTAGNV